MSSAPKRELSFEEFLLAKQEKQRVSRSASWVLFLALYPEIEEYLKAGHNAHEIWEYLHEVGAFKYSYRSFLRLLARKKAQTEGEVTVAKATANTSEISAAEKPPKEEEASGLDDNWEPLKSNRVEKKPFRVRTTPMTYEELFPQDKKA